jgi:hypothetical protein
VKNRRAVTRASSDGSVVTLKSFVVGADGGGGVGVLGSVSGGGDDGFSGVAGIGDEGVGTSAGLGEIILAGGTT